MTRSLQHALDEALGFIEQALDHIRAGEGSELELQNLRAYLLDILAAIERNPGVEAACDDLYAWAPIGRPFFRLWSGPASSSPPVPRRESGEGKSKRR